MIHNNPQHITATKTHEPTNSLRKDKIIPFKYNNDNNWNTVTLIKRAGKRIGIYPNPWNVKFQDNTIKSVDFDREVKTWKTMRPEPYTETMNSAENNSNHDNDISDTIKNLSRLSISKPNLSVQQSDETYISEIYQSAKDQEVYEAKMRELNSWREQNVYEEVPNKGQQTISVRWAIKPKITNGQHSTKTRLCARGFEELHCFQTDSPTYSRDGIRTTLATIASINCNCTHLTLRQHFSKENKSREMFFSFHRKKPIPTTFGISKNAFVD